MNIILGLGIGVIGVLVLMGHITLEKKLNILDKKMDKQKAYWKSVERSIEIQCNQINEEIVERGQFNEKAIGQLAQNVESNKIKLEKTIKGESAKIMFTPFKIKCDCK